MAAVWIRFRAEFRTRWRAWLGLALVVGLAGGLVIGAAAGARRTDSALWRFRVATAASDVMVSLYGTGLKPRDLETLPEVVRAGSIAVPGYWGRTDTGASVSFLELELDVPVDERYGKVIDRPLILSGRPATRIDELMIGSRAAEKLNVRVGSTVELRFLTPDEQSRFDRGSFQIEPNADPGTGAGPLVTFRIVGIWADVQPEDVFPIMLGTPAFYRAYGTRVGIATTWVGVHLRRGRADLASFKAGVERLSSGADVGFYDQHDFHARVQRSIHLQAQAIWLVAILGGLAALVALGQVLARQVTLESVDYPTLRALGTTRRQLSVLSMAKAALIALVGAAIAAGLAFALSALAPIGVAREAEPDPGMFLDAPIVGGGVAATIALVLLAAAVPARRAARPVGRLASGEGTSPSRSAALGLLARTRLPASAVAGVGLVLDRGGGRTAAPVRSTVAGAVAATAIVATALTFIGSLEHLASTPRLYGQNWDASGGWVGEVVVNDAVVSRLTENRAVEGLSVGTVAEVGIGAQRVGVLATDAVKGAVLPVVLEGRAPIGPDEILLGTKTLASLAKGIGDTVVASVGGTSLPLRIVGRGVLPEAGNAALSLARGAAMTFEGLKRLAPRAERNLVLIRVTAGTDGKETLAGLREQGYEEPVAPSEVGNFGRVHSMPQAIAGVFGFVAAVTLWHTLLTLTHRRRRDLAILKTLGFTRGQVAGCVAWQATTVALAGLIVGLPLGIAAGRWAWRLFAEEVGVVPEPVIPVALILLLVPGTILAANLVAALPGRIAARTRPAAVLKAE